MRAHAATRVLPGSSASAPVATTSHSTPSSVRASVPHAGFLLGTEHVDVEVDESADIGSFGVPQDEAVVERLSLERGRGPGGSSHGRAPYP